MPTGEGASGGQAPTSAYWCLINFKFRFVGGIDLTLDTSVGRGLAPAERFRIAEIMRRSKA